jgi:hypothetical protein
MEPDLALGLLRSRLASLTAAVPGLRVIEEPATEAWKATRVHLYPPEYKEPAVTLVSGSGALDVHFGHDLVLELGARDVAEAEESVDLAMRLVGVLAREGFVEELRVRDGVVLSAQATIPLGTGIHSFSTRGIQRLAKSDVVESRWSPWV